MESLDLEEAGDGAVNGEGYHWDRKPYGISVSRKK